MSLKVINRDNKLRITVNKSESAVIPNLYLLIHSRGSVAYVEAWDPVKNYIAFDTSVFPSGINHILLLTKDLQIVSERLIFLLNNDQGVASFQTQKDTYRKRERIQARIQLKDEKQQPLKGNFSIAITNDKEVVIDTTISILSDVLLRSELKGYIQNPGYYFQKGNKEAESAADLLMKTHGWTRYAIPDVVLGTLIYPNIPFETGQQFSGIVKTGVLLKPAKKAKLSLMSLSYDFWDQTESDKNGHYVFRNYWKPNVVTDDKGVAQLDFYTADDPGTYSVIIEGISDNSKLIHYCGKSLITIK